MALLRALGALAFILGVALLTLDGARAIKKHQFEATSIETLWDQIGGDAVFRLRLHLTEWLGPDADRLLDLPAALIAFGLGMSLVVLTDRGAPKPVRRPLTF